MVDILDGVCDNFEGVFDGVLGEVGCKGVGGEEGLFGGDRGEGYIVSMLGFCRVEGYVGSCL